MSIQVQESEWIDRCAGSHFYGALVVSALIVAQSKQKKYY